MSGVTAIVYLLKNNAPLVAVVSASKISAGRIPQATALPTIEVSHISGSCRDEISAQSEYCSDRVQVTVQAANYPQQKQIMSLIRAAIPRTRGIINGVNVDCILRDSNGPDFRNDEAGIYMQTQDYFVKFNG